MASVYGRPKAYVAFQVRISPELKERLARRSFETGVSQAAIVIAALQHYLDQGLLPQKESDDEIEADVGSSGEGQEVL